MLFTWVIAVDLGHKATKLRSVVDSHKKCPIPGAFLMSTHNIMFLERIRFKTEYTRLYIIIIISGQCHNSLHDAWAIFHAFVVICGFLKN